MDTCDKQKRFQGDTKKIHKEVHIVLLKTRKKQQNIWGTCNEERSLGEFNTHRKH